MKALWEKLKFWWRGIYPGIMISLIVLTMAAGIYSLAYLISSKTCEAKAEKLGVEYTFGAFEGCFIKEGGRWVDYDKTRSVR